MQCSREVYELAVVPLGELADGRSCGVLEADKFATFVEGFSGGIVAGAADACVLESGFFQDEFRVPARDCEREERRLDIGVAEPGGREMAFEVVHAVCRDSQVAGKPLGEARTDE